MPGVIRHEQNVEIKRKGNADYSKTDARTKDGWRAIRTFSSATHLTTLGKRQTETRRSRGSRRTF